MHQKGILLRITNISKIMNQKFEDLVKGLPEMPAPLGLTEKIMLQISQEKLRTLRLRVVLSVVGFFVSGGVLFSAWQLAAQEISHSGLAQFISLLSSDFMTVAIYWDNFVLSLLEALPIMSLAACLAGVLGLLASLRYFAQETNLIKNLTYKKYGF